MTRETTRQAFARQAIAHLTKRHGGEYAVIDFGEGEVQIIKGDGQDLGDAAAKDLAKFRTGFNLFGHGV